MQPKRSAGALERPSSDTARAKLRRALSRRASFADTLIALSRMLVLESKLLLLYRAQRRFLAKQTDRNLKAVDNRHGEVRVAEAAVRAVRMEPLALRSPEHTSWIYSKLITRAANTRAGLAAICADLPPEERFQTAADIQMLEELIAQWTAEGRKIKRLARRPA